MKLRGLFARWARGLNGFSTFSKEELTQMSDAKRQEIFLKHEKMAFFKESRQVSISEESLDLAKKTYKLTRRKVWLTGLGFVATIFVFFIDKYQEREARTMARLMDLLSHQQQLFYNEIVPDQAKLVETLSLLLSSGCCEMEGTFEEGELWDLYVPDPMERVLNVPSKFWVSPLEVVLALSSRKEQKPLNPYKTLAGQAKRRPLQLYDIETVFARCMDLFVKLEQLSMSLERLGDNVKIDASFFPHEIITLAKKLAGYQKRRERYPHEVAAIHRYITTKGEKSKLVKKFFKRLNIDFIPMEWTKEHYDRTIMEYLERIDRHSTLTVERKASIKEKIEKRKD